MRRFPGRRFVLFAFLACCGAPFSLAADHRLLSLVSPGGQIVAGMSASSNPSRIDNFVLMTHNSGADLKDFYALTGADSALVIHELIFVASAGTPGQLSEHSLLADGNFDRDRIYKSAVDNGSGITHYRGVSVLVVQPFARERREFGEVRWLAIPEPSVLLFGSITSVQQELDRYQLRSVVDPRLAARLSRLRRNDATWCVLSPSAWSPEMRSALAVIDPKMAAELKDGDAFQFGIHYGRYVQFEYEIAGNSLTATRSLSNTLTQSLVGPEEGLALLPPIEISADNRTVHGIIKISRTRYKAWLVEVSARGKSAIIG